MRDALFLAVALHACTTRALNYAGRAPSALTCSAPRGSVLLAAKKGAKSSTAGRGFGVAPVSRNAAPIPASELLGGYEALYGWIDAAGGTRRVAIANFEGLRGVVATAPIAKGEVAISIPSTLAIDLGVDGSDPLPAARAFLRVWRAYTAAVARSPDGVGLSDDEAAALRLRPFLEAIPPQGSSDLSTPDFFTPDELAALQWPSLEADVAARAAALGAAIAEARASGELAQLDASTLASLNWARWVVLSRVLTVQDALPPAAGYSTPRAARKLLIPLIDMCNHHATRWNGLPSGRVGGNLSIIAATDIRPGEQVRGRICLSAVCLAISSIIMSVCHPPCLLVCLSARMPACALALRDPCMSRAEAL
jgi:hypothetical protein